MNRKLKIKVKSQQIMHKRDGVVRLSQSTVPKYGVNVHNVRVHLIDISLHEICDLALRLYRHNTRYRVDRGSDLRESDLSEVCSAKNYQNHRDRGILSELGEDPTYASPTYPRFTVVCTMSEESDLFVLHTYDMSANENAQLSQLMIVQKVARIFRETWMNRAR